MDLTHTKWIGKERYHFDEIDSTNIKAKELATIGCPHGTLVMADSQNAGIGRRGRSWSSESGAGIYMSLILRPQLTTEQAPMLTLVAALAVVKAIEYSLMENRGTEDNIQKPMIKWPNDIVLNGKKLCGILTEMTLGQKQIDSIVIGIGINVANQDFPEEIRTTASSVYLETGILLERESLIEKVWEYFEGYYELFVEAGDFSSLKEEYEKSLVNKNKKVNVLDPKGTYTGTARGITNTGELLVQTEAGISEVASGEVSVRGIYGYV